MRTHRKSLIQRANMGTLFSGFLPLDSPGSNLPAGFSPCGSLITNSGAIPKTPRSSFNPPSNKIPCHLCDKEFCRRNHESPLTDLTTPKVLTIPETLPPPAPDLSDLRIKTFTLTFTFTKGSRQLAQASRSNQSIPSFFRPSAVTICGPQGGSHTTSTCAS